MEETKYKVALERDPNNPAALRALGEQAASDGKWDELADMLHREATLLPEGLERADLLLRAGRVKQGRLGDLSGALDDFRAAWSAAPGFMAAREAQREVFVALEDWESLATSLEEEADQIAELNARRSAVLDVIRADIYRFRLDDPKRAEEACDGALNRDPDQRLALVPLFEMSIEQERWSDFAAVLGKLAESSTDPADKAGWEFLRAHIVEMRLNKPSEATLILKKQAASTDEDEEEPPSISVPAAHLARAEMIDAGVAPGDLSNDMKQLVRITGAEEDASAVDWRAAFLYKLGEYKEASDDSDAAIDFYRQAHEMAAADPRPLRAMARLQRVTGRDEELAQTFDALLNVGSSASVSSLWHLLRGMTLDFGLGRIEEALEEYKSARKDADSIHGFELEAGALRRLGHWEELTALREEEADAVEDPKLKAALWAEQAEVYRYGLKNPQKAAQSLRQALSVSPTALGLVRFIAACYADAGDMSNWIRAVMGQEQLVGEQTYLIHIGLLAGDLWRRLDREDEAFKSYSAVVRLDPNLPEALLALEDICYRQKSHKNLYGVQRRILEGLGDEDEAYRRAVLLDNASLLLRHLNNPPAAKQAFEEAAAVENSIPAALMELRLRAYAENRWPDYFNISMREADAAARPPALIWRAALAAWAHEGRKDDAAELLNEVVSRRNADTSLLACTMALHYHRSDWIEWLRGAGEIIPRISEQARSLFFRQMGGVHLWRVESPDTAAECFSRMAELDPADPLAYESMKELHLEAGDLDSLREVHNSLAEIEGDDEAKAGRFFCRADLAEVSDATSNAISDLRRVLEFEPENLSALRRLERLYSALNNPTAQIEVLRREITLRKDPRLMVLLHLRIGALWEVQGRAAEAIAAYGQVPPIDPNELDALEALRRLHWQEEQWKELVEILEMYAKAAPDTEKKVQLYHERAKVSEGKLSDIPIAVKSLEAALEVDPKNIETLTELERLYEVTESWQNELNVLGQQLDLLRDAEALHRVHFKMGTVLEEKMSAPTAAIDCFVKAHDLEPQHLRTLDALERLYDQTDEAAKLVIILEEKAVLLPDERIRLYMWISRLWADPLADPQKAIFSYRRVVDLDAKHLDALNALEELYERTQEWENLIGTIGAKGEAVSDNVEAVELHCRAGSLWIDKFGDDDKAIIEYKKALELNPRHQTAIDVSRQIHSRAGRWEEVVGLYSREIEFTTDPQRKALLLAESARVIEEKIGDDGRAAAQYELALRSNPNCQEAIQPVARIYFHHEKWEQGEPLYRKWIASLSDTSDPETVAEVSYQQGRVFLGLSRDTDALDCFARSIKMKPGYIEPLKARSELYGQRREWKNALEAENELLARLEEINDNAGVGESLRRTGEYQEQLGLEGEAVKSYNRSLEIAGEVADVLERLAELYSRKELYNNVAGVLDRLIVLHQGTAEEPQVRLRKGLLLEEKTNDREGALRSYEAALAADPSYNEAHHHRASVLIDLGKWDEADEASRKLLEIEKDPERVADAHCLVGKVAMKGLKDLAAARAAYEKALEVVPGHIGAMDSIGGILEAQGDWQGYINTFEQFLKTLPPAARDKELQIHLRLGQVWRDKLNNRDKATVEFSNAVRIDPDNEEAHAALAALYIQDKNFYPQAVRENNLLLKTDPFRTESYRDLAKIFEEQREVDRAFCAYAVLEFFGVLEKWDRTNYEARLPHLPTRSQKSVDADLRDRSFIHPAARHPATNLLGALGTALCNVFGSARPTGEKAPSAHPAMKLAGEIAFNLGVDNFEIYLDGTISPAVVWCASATPAVILQPKIFEAADDRGKRFLIGRGLEGVANGLFAIWGLSESDVRKRLLVAAKLFRSDVVVQGLGEKEASTLAKQLKKEVPRKVRKGLDEAAEGHHNQERSWPFDAWLKAMIHSANRGGLILCAHPGEAARALMLLEGLLEPDSQPTRAAMEKSEQLQELLRYAVSDHYFAARKRSGFSLY